MDIKLKNDESQSTTTKRKEAKGQPDDCGQIDNIIGPFGKYQFMIFLFKILIGATSAINNLGVTFYAPSHFVSFWCADTELAYLQNHSTTLGYNPNISPLHYHHNGPQQQADSFIHGSADQYPSASSQNLQFIKARDSAWSIGKILGDFIHNTERDQRRSSVDFNSDTPRNLRKECTYLSPVDNKSHKCTSFRYDTGIWMSTIIDEWDLVCDRSYVISITQSLYMAGFIVSFLTFGYLSDRFGRWHSLLLGAIIEISSGFGCAFSTSVTQFMIFRFLLGIGCAGRSSSSYLIMIEWTGRSWRMHISTLGSLGWVLSYCAMPWLALFFLHFRHMQLCVCFYELVFLIWLLCLPESPRWLLTHRRFDEAYQVLLKAAKFNGLIKPSGLTDTESNSSKSSSESIAMKSASLLRPTGVALRKLDTSNSILAEGSFARKRLNSISLASAPNTILSNQQQQQQQQQQEQQQPHEHIILAPDHEVATHVDVSMAVSGHHRHQKQPFSCGDLLPSSWTQMQPYTMDEFDQKFAQLAETIARKEFTKNEDRLSFLDLFRWKNLRKYTFILAFAWSCNSFIYYGIALRVGDFGGKNLFVSFSLAGATELPSILFTILFMKFLPRKTTNILMFSTIFLLCALHVPLKYYELGWLQQTSMILAKLFNSCSFICILYQTMELFPTSIRQTAYSSCSLAGRIGSILAPFIKELSQMTNNLVPPVMYAILSLMEIVLIRHLPETQGSDLPDTLLEAEKFKGTDKPVVGVRKCNGAARALECTNGTRTKLPPT